MSNLIILINQRLKIRLSTPAKQTITVRYCFLFIIFLVVTNAVVAQTNGSNVTYEEAFASLKTNRNRLLNDYAASRSVYSARRLWDNMSASEKGVFLTLTDYLGRRSFLNHSYGKARTEFDTMLNHVTKIYAIRGSNYSDCGGIEHNRIFFQADDALMYNIRNIQFLPNWRNSTDINGPHYPFTQSREGVPGKPRVQIHEWAFDYQSETLYRPGVVGINDPHLVEMDMDYDFLHHSNPECSYDGVYGRNLYQNFYYYQGLGGSAEFDYIPTNMPVGSDIVGNFQSISSEYPIVASGWALIPNEPQTSAEVVFFIDGNPWDEYSFSYTVIANLPRPDVNQETGVSGNHGFEFRIPDQFCDGVTHYISAYGSRNMMTQLPLDNGGFRAFSCIP